MRMLTRTYAREAAPPSAGSPLPAWSNSRWWTSSRYTAARIRRSRVPRRGSASAASVTLTDGAARSSYGTWPSNWAREFGCSNTFRPWSGLPQEPLRHRRLGDPERVGKPALGQAALFARALECLPESPSLLGRCHVLLCLDAPVSYKHA